MEQRTIVDFSIGVGPPCHHLPVLSLIHLNSIVEIPQKYHLSFFSDQLAHNSRDGLVAARALILVRRKMAVDELKLLSENGELNTDGAFVSHDSTGTTSAKLILPLELEIVL